MRSKHLTLRETGIPDLALVNTGRKIPKTPIENSPVLQSILILAAQQSGVLRP
jgi:hypothetical protein